jgi:hypothetical protein
VRYRHRLAILVTDGPKPLTTRRCAHTVPPNGFAVQGEIMRFWRACIAFLATAVFGSVGHAATIFNFQNFNDCSQLQLNGNAACTGGVLRVTPANFNQAGSAFSTTLIPLGAGATFSTFFTFRFTTPGGSSDSDGLGADGIVFVIQPVSSTVGAVGGGIGYQGIPNSLGVEFDTWNNGVPLDQDGNHVGVDLNGSVASVAAVAIPARINNGATWFAWIDYDGTTLTLRLSQTSTRPAAPTLSQVVNLASVLGTTQAFVGFTSGTGAAFENHDVLTWRFDNAFAPIGVAARSAAVPTLDDAGLVLLALLLLAASLGRKRSERGT